MRANLCHLYYGVFYLLVAVLVVGCYEVRQGRYVTEKVPGWSRRDDSSMFHYPTKKTPDWFVQIAGTKVGVVHLWIGSESYDPYKIWTSHMLSFSGTPIRVIFHDQNREAVIPPDGFQTLFGQDLDVDGSQDFTVIVPSFKISDSVVPELSAHVRWSNDKYRIMERLN